MKFSLSMTTCGNTLVIYGDAKIGKTTSIMDIVRAGYTVHYLDLDRNTATFAQLEEKYYGNFNIYRPDLTPRHLLFTIESLLRTGVLNICHAHGRYKCKECGDTNVDVVDFKNMTNMDVFVIDSYSALYAAIVQYVAEKDNLNLAETKVFEREHHQAVNYYNDTFWRGLVQLALGCPTIIIAHPVDVNASMDSKVSRPALFAPRAGSKPYSRGSAMLYASAVVPVDENGEIILTRGKGYMVSNPLGDKAKDCKTLDSYLKLWLGTAPSHKITNV